MNRGPNPRVEPSSGHPSYRASLRSVLRVTRPNPYNMVDEEHYRQVASDEPANQHAAPNTSPRDPRLAHRGDSPSISPTQVGPMPSSVMVGAV
jgi:hypothetical protein